MEKNSLGFVNAVERDEIKNLSSLEKGVLSEIPIEIIKEIKKEMNLKSLNITNIKTTIPTIKCNTLQENKHNNAKQLETDKILTSSIDKNKSFTPITI